MQSYYITWNNEFRVEKVCLKPHPNRIYVNPPDLKERPNALILEHSAFGCSKTNYTKMELPKDLEHVYVVEYCTGGSEMRSYYSLFVFPEFDDVVCMLEDSYADEHQHDADQCSLCKKTDGKERCLMRAKGRLANNICVEFGNDSIAYNTIAVCKDLKKETEI